MSFWKSTTFATAGGGRGRKEVLRIVLLNVSIAAPGGEENDY